MQEKYANLLLESCLNITTKKSLLISCPIEAYQFVRILVEKAYLKGVKDIYIDYNDEVLKQLQIKNFNEKELENSPFWNKKIYDEYAKKDAAFLMLNAYEEIDNIDSKKSEYAAKVSRLSRPLFKEKQLNNEIVWCIAAVATKTWANKMFPNQKNNIKKLWDTIYKICLVDKNNPINSWNQKIRTIEKRANYMNKKQYKYLHFKNSLGTDLMIELPKNHIWASGQTNVNGEKVIENMPTEEIFTAPYKLGTNGIVYNSKPLIYNGVLIDNFIIKFNDGKVVDFKAEKGYDTLKSIIEFDETSNMLGEIALVDYDSTISNSGLIFYETLYDENASCHMALGAAYLECIDHNQTPEEIHRQINQSNNHVDFMFGTSDLEVIGIKIDGTKETIMKNGNFVK